MCRNFPEWLTAGDIYALTEVSTSKVVHSFGNSPPRSWSVMMASSSSQQSPSSQCPTWLSGRRRCRPAIQFDFDMQSPAKSLPPRMRRNNPGKTGLQVPSQARIRRQSGRLTGARVEAEIVRTWWVMWPLPGLTGTGFLF